MKRLWFTLVFVFGCLPALSFFAFPALKATFGDSGYQNSSHAPVNTVHLEAYQPGDVLISGRSLLPVSLPPLQTFDGEKCRILLEKTADRLGWPEPEIYVNDYGDEASCQMSFYGSQNGVPIKIDVQITVQPGWCDDCAYYCESAGNQNNCECVEINGLPGRLSLPLENQGTFLTFCDPYCNLVFHVNTLAEDNQLVDPQPVADALYYSALEINCCQVVEAALPGEVQPTEETMLPPSGVPFEGSDTVTEPFSRSPVVPLTGALIGTLIGWVISVVVTNWSALLSSFASTAQPSPVSIPQGELPKTWDEWEKSYIPHELPTYHSPDIHENRSVHITVEDAKSAVIHSYFNDLPAESRARVANARMKKVDADEFDAEYIKVFGQDEDYTIASAFVVPSTGEILVCTPREINYTPVHELMHVASNNDFGRLTNRAMDEAVTEYFTQQITSQHKVVRSSEYDELGSTDVVKEIVKSYGQQILRKAYFQPGRQGVDELRHAIDQKMGAGAFEKVVELMGRQAAPPKQMALDLLRGQGIRR